MYFHNNHKKTILKRLTCLIIITVVSVVSLSTFSSVAEAVGGTSAPKVSGVIKNPLGQDNVIEFILALTVQLTRVGLIVAAIFIIYSGFLFVFARGSEDGIKKAKIAFFYTIVGTAILLGARVIVEILRATIGALG